MAEPTTTYRPTERTDGVSAAVPRVGTFEAVRRNWMLALVPVVLFVGAALIIGVQRDPVYTADTRMSVGGIDVTQPGALAGFAVAGESLATTYSRTIDAEGVVVAAARATGLSRQAVRDRIAAAPVPDSPVFRVSAEGPAPRDAAALANASAVALAAYVGNLARPRERSDRLFEDYREAAREYNLALERRGDVEELYAGDQSAANLQRMVDQRGETSAARLRLQGLQESYLKSINARASSPGVTQLSKATGATSDRGSTLQLYLFVGLVAGVLGGIALARLHANRLVRRRIIA